MTKLAIDGFQLQKELEEAQARLSAKPNRWVGYEKVGRVLHWMKDLSASDYFMKAAQIRVGNLKPGRVQGWELLTIGNYYRLAKELDLATNYFLRAYEMLKMQVGNIDKPEEVNFRLMQHLIMVCYILGKYEETAAYGRSFQEDNPNFNPKNMAYVFVKLAEARLTNNIALAQSVVDDLTININKNLKLGNAKIQATGDITGFDLYELAIETLTEIEDAG